ncbi:hypothetical protein vBRpoSV10_21 [Ruegeria phage vB_RpoS-V10]|nr:hypothetical protein DSS3P8_022 [Roseobacter phage DSS3P8]AWY09143.1 hypothetical protein vBRpoSV10_21 [Ruegeria phage vB_RpoS-V10]
MGNIDELRDLYAAKKEQGLVDVKFALSDSARGASADEIAGEVLALNAAIAAGAYKKLDFGDSHLVKALEARHPEHKVLSVCFAAEQDEKLAEAVRNAVEVSVDFFDSTSG